MKTGKRQATIWGEITWVTVRPTKESNKYRIEPDEGKDFDVTADTNDEMDDEITQELRRQFPDR